MQNVMQNPGSIAIIGATGNVGRKITTLLLQRKSVLPRQLRLFASSRTAGQSINFDNHAYTIEDLQNYDFANCGLAIFATESEISKSHIPVALEMGAKVIDTSSAYRLQQDVPLIVPPINSNLINKEHQLYALANCLACPISVVLKPLHDHHPITRLLISTYQSTSGAGKGPMDELYWQTKSVFTNETVEKKYFQRGIAFNVIPQVDKIMQDGFTYEEYKIIHEIQKIISSEIKIAATAVRVPVMIGHCISLAVEFRDAIKVEDVRTHLLHKPGVQLSEHDYTTPIEVEGKDNVFVGRIRKDPSVNNGILMWLTSDNLRRGAALDAVETAEAVLKLL